MANTTVYPFGTNGQLPSSIGIVNDLITGGVDKALSAEMGKELGTSVTTLETNTTMPMEMARMTIEGTIHGNDGTDWNVAGYYRTPYFRFDPLKPLYAKGDSNKSSRAFVAFYDDDLAFISAVNNVGSADEEHAITIPNNATLARATCTSAQQSDSYITQKVQPLIKDEVSANESELNATIDILKGVPTSQGYLVNGKASTHLCVTTDFIRIDDALSLELYIPKYSANVAGDVLSFYSARDEDAYISGIAKTSGVVYKCLQILTIPSGAKYVRLCAISNTELTDYSLTCKKIDYINALANALNEPEYTPARFLLPKYMDVVVGRQCDFWVQDTIENPRNMPYIFNIPSGVTNFGNGHMRITASSAGTSTLDLVTLKEDFVGEFADYDNIVNTQSINIRKVAKTGGSGTFNVLIVGDSLVAYSNGANPVETYKLLAEDADVTINQIGLVTDVVDGVTYRHEGHGGWSYATFIGNDSPFVFNGTLSFSQYMQTNFPALSGIDLCLVLLGTNDNRDVVVANAKTFIDQLVADYPNCKVAVGIPAYGVPCQGTTTSAERNIKTACKRLIDAFDNGRYKANVTCIGHGCWIDRVNDYPHTEVDATPYSSAKIIKYTNDIHPDAQGYKQWGRAVYCKIRSWIAGNL